MRTSLQKLGVNFENNLLNDATLCEDFEWSEENDHMKAESFIPKMIQK